jgi:hypothetical protein
MVACELGSGIPEHGIPAPLHSSTCHGPTGVQPIGRNCSRSVGPAFPHGIRRWQRPAEPKPEADKPRAARSAMCRLHVARPQDSLDRDNDMLARTRALLGLPPPAAQPKQPLLLQPPADMPEDMEKAPWGASLQGEPECARSCQRSLEAAALAHSRRGCAVAECNRPKECAQRGLSACAKVALPRGEACPALPAVSPEQRVAEPCPRRCSWTWSRRAGPSTHPTSTRARCR